MPFDAYRAMLDATTAAVTGLATTGSSVYESPRSALDGSVFPALAVLAREIRASVFAVDPDTDDNLELHQFEIIVSTIALTRDQRDTSSLEVKTAILATAKPGYQRRYLGTSFEETAEGDRPLWVASQRFEIDYHVQATVPGVTV